MKSLSLRRILLYSSASAGLNIVAITVGTWILYFYAPPPDSGRVQYLPVTLVGVLLTVTGLWDALIDPFIGHWSDTARSRWGRRRPFLIFAAPAMALLLILIWMPPQGAPVTLTAIYFFLITSLFYTAYSLVGIPYDGTMPEMASSPQELVTLSTWKSVFGTSGVLIGSLVAALLFESMGPVAMGAVVAMIGLITIWLTLAGLRKTVRPHIAPMGALDGIRATFQNRQFLRMFVSALIVHVAYAMILANLPYFVTLVVGRSEGDVAIFQGVVVLIMLAAAPVWNRLGRKYENRKLLMASMVGLGLAALLNFTVGMISAAPRMAHALVTLALTAPLLGGYFIMAYAAMGSVVDYDEMLTGRRREAIYYGTFSLAAGIGPALAALILPQILEGFGYTAANPMGVRVAWLVTGAIALLGAAAFVGYRLGDTPYETRRNLNLDTAGNDPARSGQGAIGEE
jgi:GPH family glycoside/pentoside/hexuronide:cation symporter